LSELAADIADSGLIDAVLGSKLTRKKSTKS